MSGNSIPILIDSSPDHFIWNSWNAYQRALFFLNKDGNYVTDFNITTWNYDGYIHANDLVYAQIISIIENDALNIHFQPDQISLLRAYPNPFNPSTNITFIITKSSHSIISIYNMAGRYIETLSQSYYTPGSYTLAWDADEYASGIYFIKFETDFNTLKQKLILIK